MKKIIYIFGFLVYFSTYSQESEVNYVIDFITTKQGLSHNYVSSIVSDDLNIKWIGTENGITKYNGYDFDYIKPSKDYDGLLNENIEVLFKDRDNNLWIGTKSGGLSYLDIKNNTIKNFNHLIDLENEGDLRVISLSQDDKGNIWIGTWSKGVFQIDFQNEKLLQQFKTVSPVYTIVNDFNGNVWYAINKRLYKYIPIEDKRETYDFNNFITDILPDAFRKKIWITTSGLNNKKLFNYNYVSNGIETIETEVVSEFSKKLFLDKDHHLWIGTWGYGVYKSNTEITQFDKIELLPRNSQKTSANYNTILNIHQDKNNILWLATANGGLVRLVENNGFKNADKLIDNPELEGHLNTLSVYRNNNTLFVGTVFSGVYYGKDLSQLKQIKEVGNIRIYNLYEYDEKLFIGTSKGFFIFDLVLEKIIFSSDIINKATSFHVDNERNLYIGSQQQGLAIVKLDSINYKEAYVLYSENSTNKQKLESNRITGIQEDLNHNIWIGSYNGLHLFNQKEKTFINQSLLLKEKLPSVIINSISLKADNIWLATPSGLFKLNYRNEKLELLESITKENGLNSDFICAVTFDNNSNIWFSTHTEIVKYNEVNKTILSYGDINGVKSTSFNNSSFYNYKNEQIYFGGIDNITFFNPNTVTNINSVPEIIFTNLRINNNLIQYKKGSKILDNNINYAKEIKLTHNDNFFSTTFVANDFLGKLNIKYRYKLEGYQDSWIDLQDRNEINFAGLSPGNYSLKIEASRDNQIWSAPKSINIIMLTSPWKSTLALIGYLIGIILIVTYFIKSNNTKLKLKNKLEIARIDKEKEIELTEAKLNFFTNISHEFRTPLTLIIGPLKEILENEKLSAKALKNLNLIDRNTNRLLNLINQLLDFRKADHGLLKLDVSKGNFVRFANEVFLYFKEAAKTKDIKYKFKTSQEEIIFPFDRNKMEIVLCNLLSNAIKYSQPGDRVTLKVDVNNEYCIFSVKDTGIGIKSEYLGKIFDRFFQIKSGNTARMIGSGIGLTFSKKIVELHYGTIEVTSEKNIGSEFTIKLSMDPKLYGEALNDNFLNTDNINAYNTKDFELPVKNLNINAKDHSVLIIDDNLDILNYLNDILSDNYKVLQAENGDLGYEMASTEIPDLIISDVMMPGKDGITLCKELKSHINTSHIPIILLTARTSTVFEIEGLKTGADDYITKPFNANVIKARIASLLENREKSRAHLLNKVRFEPTVDELHPEADTENAFINKAILLVENNLDNLEFGIENMVDDLHMSQSTLYRKIKSLTGLSLTAFIRSVRLKKAAHLIISSDLNLNQIAYEVGFNDYKYFKTSFKKQFNCLPSKYKELIKK
ncbi:response regulator [Gaetbulibacter aquiaggeris]|uniref:histidine kinase n=1 Tax=Gaetbulibacter aquiaggeris TaxID=1735373 RepID=A0ABW7MSE5_9FLAO